MSSNARALRLLKTIDYLTTKSSLTSFEKCSVFNKVKLQSSSNGTIKGSFLVDKTMCNFAGGLHGGYIAAIIDVLSFYTQLTTPDGKAAYTTNMNVNYVKAVGDGEQVIVETKTLKSGKSALVETYFHNDKGILLAKGTITFLAGGEPFQKLMKDTLHFDVNEN
ncbi:unnamed protein product [Chrysodeixis includens]|uniref:Thioesterase domain-containing protein n=1 Tax=Chrysodeixis includens TaxID=689277 RepID=A0A9N8L597_CHRIL|nr:unnamed protein product [Chrysodeixis includens]